MKAILSQLFSMGGSGILAGNRQGKSKSTSPFGKLLGSILGKKTTRPVAYVRGGREVSFEKIPFIDKYGTPLKIETVAEGNSKKVRIQRAGRLGKSNQVATDSALRRELVLSNNGGVSQAIPNFRNQVRAHLRETEELRLGILSGKIETPGNKDGRLKRKLKEEAKNEDFAVDTAWLEQVKSHLSRSRGGEAGSLRALAEAMNSAKKGGEQGKTDVVIGKDGKIQAKGEKAEKIELADPTQPRVKKFKPQKIDSRTGLPIPEAPAEQGKKGKAAKGTVKAEVPKIKASGNTPGVETGVQKSRNGEVVERITFQRTDEKAAPLSESERRNQIVKALREGKAAPEKNVRPTAPKPIQEQTTDRTRQDAKPAVKQAAQQSNESSGQQQRTDSRSAKQQRPEQPINRAEPAKPQPGKPQQVQRSAERVNQQGESQPNTTHTTQKSVVPAAGEQIGEQKKTGGWRMHTPGDLQPSGRARARANRPGMALRGDDSRLVRGRKGGERVEGARTRLGKVDPTVARREVKVNAQAAPQASNPVAQVSDNGAATSVKAPQPHVSTPTPPTPQPSQTSQGAETQKALTNLQEVLTKLETNAKVLVGNGETRLSVRLKPAALGSIAVQIHKRDGRYDVSMRAAHPDAARAIEQQLPMIREQLAQSGIQVEKFDIQSGAERFEDTQDQRAGQREGSSGNGASSDSRQSTNRNETATSEEAAIPRRLNTGTNTVEYMG